MLTKKVWQMCCAVAVASVSLWAVSCADDGFNEDERYVHEVTNTQMSAIPADSISIEASADKSQTVISWPLVYGASGFHLTVYNITDAENAVLVADTVIDGYSVAVVRGDDQSYKLSLATLGDASLGNSDASAATVKTFETYAYGFKTIPDGTDLYVYFMEENNWPTEDGETTYDLVRGGKYTVSGTIDFSTHYIALRTLGKEPHATVTYGEAGAIEYCGGLTLKDIDFELGAAKNFLAFSANPTFEAYPLNDATNSFLHITKPTSIKNCNILNLTRYFVYDNTLAYWVKDFVVSDCVVKMATGENASSGALFFVNKGGGAINNLKVENSTFYNTTSNEIKYVIQYGGNRCVKAGYESCSTAINSCTFYNVAPSGQFGNYSGFSGKTESEWIMTKNIFVNCCKDVARRFLGGRTASTYSTVVFGYNTYPSTVDEATGAVSFETGVSADGSQVYDNSETVITTDPQLKDPENGDFTVQGSEQLANQTGDPRWLE